MQLGRSSCCFGTKMNLIITLVVLALGSGTRVVNGAVNYAGIPYNVYGNSASMQQSYLRSPIQYGARQQSPSRVPVRRGYYPAAQPRTYAPVHPRAFAPVQPRVYAPVHPRAYAPVQPRVYAPVQPRAYAPQPRTYAPVSPRTYAPVQPKGYTPVHPRAYTLPQLRAYAPVSPRTYAPAQLKAYAQASAAARTYGQRSSWYPSNPKSRVAYAPARQPISNAAAVRQPNSNAFLRQPIRNVPVQRPVSRTITPGLQWYRNAPMSVPYPQGYAAAQRSGVPVRLVAYGRNHIPRTPSRNTLLKNPTKAANQQKMSPSVTSPDGDIKRNNIALNKKPNVVLPQMTQVARNHINGIVFPSKTITKEHTAIQPSKPSSDATPPTGQKLSSFLKKVKNFRDTLKGDIMKQGLIYYNDDVSNKTRHRPTNFAPPTRKLGSQGAPGGSRVSLSNKDKIRPEINSKTASQTGSERDTIKETGENTVGEKIPGDNSPEEKIPREHIPGEKAPGDLSQTVQSNTTSSRVKVESQGTNNESKMASHFDNPKVDLGLLKEKVLHSNNSQFLKRVLQVLKKYTKLMKSSMAEKNMTNLRPGVNIMENGSNISLAESQKQNSSLKGSSLKKIDTKLKGAEEKNLSTELNKNLIATESKNESQLEDNPLALENGFNSTSTAIKIFDLLNKASKLNSEKLTEKESSHINTDEGKNGSEKANSGSSVKDENASKKGEIETEHNLGKPVFNLMKLQNGLERGNTIN